MVKEDQQDLSEEKYFLSRSQYGQIKALTLRGTKLNMAIKGCDFSPLRKNLLNLHQQARDVVKLSTGSF